MEKSQLRCGLSHFESKNGEKESPGHFYQNLKLAPGLYYLSVGQVREASVGGGFEMFWFGKVVVK